MVTQSKASGHDGRSSSSAKSGALLGQQFGSGLLGWGLQLEALQPRLELTSWRGCEGRKKGHDEKFSEKTRG